MVRLLEALRGERLFGRALAEDFFRVLSTNKDGYLTALLPEDVRVANKPGSLEAVRTDSGVVYATNRPFAISVMTAYARDERAARETIGRIALAAYHYFDLAGRASPYGRLISPR
jgi:beta-lactamase class A